MDQWFKNIISPNVGYAVGFLGVFYSTRAVKSNELRKIRHQAFLEFSQKVSDGARIADNIFLAQKGGHLTEEQISDEVHAMDLKYNEWLTSIDKVQATFMLAAPNYVSKAGRDYYGSARDFYGGRGTFRHYQYYGDIFQSAAKFDLRHYVYSYLRSVLFLFSKYAMAFIHWCWEYINFHDWFSVWLFKKDWYRWHRNKRNAEFEFNLRRIYGINFVEKIKGKEFDKYWEGARKKVAATI